MIDESKMSSNKTQEQDKHTTITANDITSLPHHPPHGTNPVAVFVATDNPQVKSAAQITNEENTYQPLILPKTHGSDNSIEYQSLMQLTTHELSPISIPPKSKTDW